MSFKDILAKAKAKAEGLAAQHHIGHKFSSSQSQSQAPTLPNNGYAPPIPPNKPILTSHSDSSHQIPPYWQPSFNHATPVSEQFKHQTGAHGWGNQELQNYVPAPDNSFYTSDGKLIVRAIARDGQFTSARLTSHMTLSKQRGSLVAGK